MKATGIIRRMDDLGRIVIPKEIRTENLIQIGDPFEIFTDKDEEGNPIITFRRVPVNCVDDVLHAVEAMSRSTDFDDEDHLELQNKLLKIILDYKVSHKN